jgi:hypothetical protein
MVRKHTREEARLAKTEAAARFKDDGDVTSIGIGMTEDRSDLAVTITVRNSKALSRLPRCIGTVPVRSMVSGSLTKFA